MRETRVAENFKSPIFRLTQTTRRMKMLGEMTGTATPSILTRQTRLARQPPTLRLTCVSEIARLAKVVSKWTRLMSRRLRSITGTGIQVYNVFFDPVLFSLSTWSRSGTTRTRLRSSVLVRGEKR